MQEFVISTSDIPSERKPEEAAAAAAEADGQPLPLPQPVLRFCKTDKHFDILIPIYHFYMQVLFYGRGRSWGRAEGGILSIGCTVQVSCFCRGDRVDGCESAQADRAGQVSGSAMT